jgi:hypothetical protein
MLKLRLAPAGGTRSGHHKAYILAQTPGTRTFHFLHPMIDSCKQPRMGGVDNEESKFSMTG